MNKRVNIIGANISVTNMNDLLKNVVKIVDDKKTDYICVSNVHTTVITKKDNYFKEIINSSFMSVPDGMPLVWVGKNKGYNDIGRTTGPEIMDKVFKLSLEKGYTHYFYGSTKEMLQFMKKNILKDYPGINVVGMRESLFRPLTEPEDKEVLDEINSLNPDIIWVGLGAPRQEKWMYEHKARIKSSLMIGVGGAFAIYAGLVNRAPEWMQNNGLEWFYRFIKEPERMWKRYLTTNSKFILYLFLNKIKR